MCPFSPCFSRSGPGRLAGISPRCVGGLGLGHKQGRPPWMPVLAALQVPWSRTGTCAAHSGTAALSGMESSWHWAEIDEFLPSPRPPSHPPSCPLAIHSPTHSESTSGRLLLASLSLLLSSLCARSTLGKRECLP